MTLYKLVEDYADLCKATELGKLYAEANPEFRANPEMMKKFIHTLQNGKGGWFVLLEEIEDKPVGLVVACLAPYTYDFLKLALTVQILYTTKESKEDWFKNLEDVAKQLNADYILIGHRVKENFEVYKRLYRVKGFTPQALTYIKEI